MIGRAARGGRGARIAIGAALLGGLVTTLVAACDTINNHLLEGQQYSAAGACLAAPTVIDDLPGGDPGSGCTPACLKVSVYEGGTAVFITTTCPPYAGYTSPAPELPDAAHDAADPCVGAFAVYFSDAAACTTLDAGVDAATEAGGDARADAALEASADGAAEVSTADAPTSAADSPADAPPGD